VLLTLAQVQRRARHVRRRRGGWRWPAAVRVCLEIVRSQRPLKSAGYDLWIGLAAVISIGLAHLILWGSMRSAASTCAPPKNGLGLAPISALPTHAWETGYNLLILFGADFFGRTTVVRRGPGTAPPDWVALALWGLLIGLFGFFRPCRGPGHSGAGGQHRHHLGGGNLRNYMSKIVGAHEIVTVLPFCRGARRQAPRRPQLVKDEAGCH